MQVELDSLEKNILRTWTILDDLDALFENTDENGNYIGKLADTTSVTLLRSIKSLYALHFEDLYKSYEKMVDTAVSIEWSHQLEHTDA